MKFRAAPVTKIQHASEGSGRFAVLEPTADGFRNYVRNGHKRPAEDLLVDRAHTLTLTAPEMTVLVGGMRVLNANVGQSELGVLLQAIAEVYACDDSQQAFVRDFVAAWGKVMNPDRFDL